MSDSQVGAIVEQGPSDWQIIQQDAGFGTIALNGRAGFLVIRRTADCGTSRGVRNPALPARPQSDAV